MKFYSCNSITPVLSRAFSSSRWSYLKASTFKMLAYFNSFTSYICLYTSASSNLIFKAYLSTSFYCSSDFFLISPFVDLRNLISLFNCSFLSCKFVHYYLHLNSYYILVYGSKCDPSNSGKVLNSSGVSLLTNSNALI